jgi:hypothetical protein
VPSEIQAVTGEIRHAAVELLKRFFREEGFTTPPARIAENLDRMLADPCCWCALAVDGGTPQAVITVSTVLYVEWGRLGEIGDLYVLPEHRRCGPGAASYRARQGLVPRARLLGGFSHHYADGRATASAQPLLRSARLRADRPQKRLRSARYLTAGSAFEACPFGITTRPLRY